MQDLAQRSIGGRSRKTNAALLLILFLATAVVFCLNIAMGAVQIDLLDILRILVSDVNEELTDSLIILRIRLPRALATIGGEMALAISGLLLQAFFNNPIVEPYVLGISSGSSLLMALVTLGGFTFGIARITPIRDKDILPVVVLISDGRANASKSEKKPADEVLQWARKLGDMGAKCIVIDTENDFIRLKLAEMLAEAMGADYQRRIRWQNTSDASCMRCAMRSNTRRTRTKRPSSTS